MQSSGSTPRNVFLHLLMIGTLIASVTASIGLFFQYANAWFPDPITTYRESIRSSIRIASSTLIVIFPVFLLLSITLARDLVRHAELRESRVRRWLLNFAIFATAITLIIDAITVVNYLYNGELTARFLLKAGSVLVVAGLVFWYYRFELTRDAGPSPIPRIVTMTTSTILLTAIIGGFFIAGTPAQIRRERLDDQRVSNLREIQWQVVSFWQQKERLPQNLDDLRDDLSGFVSPRDPETGIPFEYRTTAALSFELCAVFATAGSDDKSARPMIARPVMDSLPSAELEDSWTHAIGRHCFARTIDPERYTLPVPEKRP